MTVGILAFGVLAFGILAFGMLSGMLIFILFSDDTLSFTLEQYRVLTKLDQKIALILEYIRQNTTNMNNASHFAILFFLHEKGEQQE